MKPIPYSADVKYEPSESSNHGEVNGLKHKKVTVVGCGQVGMAIAYAILNQEIAGSISLVDINSEKLDGEVRRSYKRVMCSLYIKLVLIVASPGQRS